MRDALREGGQLLVTFKSTRYSRFKFGELGEGVFWRRQIISDDQKGLELDFFDEPRLNSFLDGVFRLRRLLHLEKVGVRTKVVLTDWSATIERAR